MRVLHSLRARSASGDEGFTLVETLVALSIAVVALLGLLGASVFAVQATVTARQNQQAGDFLNQRIEQARSQDYTGTAMVLSDLVGDPAITFSAGVYRYDTGVGVETVDARTTGSIAPHVETPVTSNGAYTIKRYVTIPATATMNAQGVPSVRRLTVEVSWKHGRTRTLKASTMLTNTRRGLPLPHYTWLYNGSASVVADVPTHVKNPGNDVEYGFALTNLGARDAWTLTASTPGWTFYADTDADGTWSELPGEPLLAGAVTPLLEAGQATPYYVVAHRTTGLAENGTSTTTFSARSVSQPTVAAKSVLTRLTVTTGTAVQPTPSSAPSATPTSSGPCTPGSSAGTADMSGTTTTAKPSNSYTTTRFNLANGPATGDTTTQVTNTMSTDPNVLQAQLCNFSTEVAASRAGRHLAAGGAASPSTASVAKWSFQPTANKGSQIGGTAAVALLVQCPTAGSVTLAATLNRASNGALLGQGSASVPASCNAGGFVRLDVPVTVDASNPVVAKTDRLVLSVTTSAAVRLAYGTAAANSRLTLAVK